MNAPSHEEQHLLAAYHDDELDAATRARVEAHVRQCATCARELESLRDTSQPFRPLRDVNLTRRQLAALHAAVDDAAADDARFMRTAATLAVIAASVLLVSLAWLRVLTPAPTAPGAGPAGAVAASNWSSREQAWEHVAVTLRPDPLTLPITPDPDRQLAEGYDAALADWMLQGLQPRVER